MLRHCLQSVLLGLLFEATICLRVGMDVSHSVHFSRNPYYRSPEVNFSWIATMWGWVLTFKAQCSCYWIYYPFRDWRRDRVTLNAGVDISLHEGYRRPFFHYVCRWALLQGLWGLLLVPKNDWQADLSWWGSLDHLHWRKFDILSMLFRLRYAKASVI